MTNEDFLARTSIELDTIYKKINKHLDEILREDREHPDGQRIQIVRSIINTAITLANESDSESIAYVADLLDSVAEDCTYLAEELDKQ